MNLWKSLELGSSVGVRWESSTIMPHNSDIATLTPHGWSEAVTPAA